MPTPHGRVLIIAGSDSGGGAGIQGDIKTVSALGGYAMTAITALTAQNTLRVSDIFPVPPAFIAEQIRMCLSDIGADAIKTGMLHSAGVIETVVASLPQRGSAGVGAEQALPPHVRPKLTYPKPTTLTNAKELRKQPTDAEKKLWQHVRQDQLGVRFRRQHPIGPYIADFFCLDAKLIIELDGGQHNAPETQTYDATRTAFMEAQGFHLLRFWNHDVLQNSEGVVLTIQQAIAAAHSNRECLTGPHPNPPPLGEGILPLVVDPVMVAKGGAPLLESAALHALKTLLIPAASIITPNLPEAELLLGRSIASDDPDATDMKRAAEELLKLGCAAVLLKGGHGTGDVLTDVLISNDGAPLTLSTPRIATTNTHGTGCTFASAIATGLAQKQSLNDAVIRAHAYVQAAIARAPGFGAGNGPLGH